MAAPGFQHRPGSRPPSRGSHSAAPDELRERLDRIESRNAEVESSKAWEVSWTRRLSIAALTYAVLGVYLTAIGVSDPWVHAVVPTTGYLLSTLALGRIRTLWVRRRLADN